MLHIVTGGSGSGKSAFAEEMACRYHKQNPQGKMLYIATMIPYGEETEKKIQRHRKLRAGKGFETMECYTDLEEHVAKNVLGLNATSDATSDATLGGLPVTCVLLECMSNLVANEVFREDDSGDETVVSRILRGVKALEQIANHVVIVTNEVFHEPLQDSEEMQYYKQVLGKINCRLAEMAACVTEVVNGIPYSVKGMCVETEEAVVMPEMTATIEVAESVEERGAEKMRLIIGGSYQGKLTFAQKKYPEITWIDGMKCQMDEIEYCRGIYHFHEYVKRWMQNENETDALAKMIHDMNPEIIIVSDEIGSGLVPVDAFERNYRESVGRVCTEIAGYADEVYRVICGVGLQLK